MANREGRGTKVLFWVLLTTPDCLDANVQQTLWRLFLPCWVYLTFSRQHLLLFLITRQYGWILLDTHIFFSPTACPCTNTENKAKDWHWCTHRYEEFPLEVCRVSKIKRSQQGSTQWDACQFNSSHGTTYSTFQHHHTSILHSFQTTSLRDKDQ